MVGVSSVVAPLPPRGREFSMVRKETRYNLVSRNCTPKKMKLSGMKTCESNAEVEHALVNTPEPRVN